LRLRPVSPDDLPLLMCWRADPEVQEFYGRPPDSLAEAHDMFLAALDVPGWKFIVEEEGRPVGEIQYYHPYESERWSAGIDLFIGEPGDRNRGLGTEAARTLLQYLFETIGANLVTIGPEPANRRAIRSYEKAGFRKDALVRRTFKVDDRWVDAVHMTILDEEWPAARARWEAETGVAPSGTAPTQAPARRDQVAQLIELPDPTDHEPIQGPRVRLRPVTSEDLPLLLLWLADPGVQEFCGLPPASLAEVHDTYLVAEDVPCWCFIIEEEGHPVGEIQYWYPYASECWSAGIDIFIGAAGDRDRGLGTEAVRTLLQHLFEIKGVNRATIDPEVGNRRAIRVYQKAGYRIDGVIRRNDRVDDRWVDAVHMTILDDEWPAAKKAWETQTGWSQAG